MRTIEISTTQSVVIQYKLATATERSIAAIIDIAVISIFGAILLSITSSIPFLEYVIYFILSFYTLLSEVILDGQTLGKKALGIRVIKEDGTQPDISNFFNRWALRFLDIWLSLGGIAIITILSSDKCQRFGDKSGSTIVVKQRSDSFYSLDNLISLNKNSKKEIKYPEVTNLNESDVLALKRLVIRVKNNNQDMYHRDIVIQTKKSIEDKLDIKSQEKDNLVFIKTIIKEYVILTR